jgi:1-acyl-sn-glycerol-3-phosphate acyltransferase
MSMVIFPEGTRTYTGQMGDFTRGSFILFNEIGLPIVPMTINGCYDVFSRTATSVSRSKISLTIHKPITAEECPGKPTKVFRKDVFDIVNVGVEEKYRK